jgi:hypothetical protein
MGWSARAGQREKKETKTSQDVVHLSNVRCKSSKIRPLTRITWRITVKQEGGKWGGCGMNMNALFTHVQLIRRRRGFLLSVHNLPNCAGARYLPSHTDVRKHKRTVDDTSIW